MLLGSAFLTLPGAGPIMAGGLLATWTIVPLGTAAVVGGLSAIGGALASTLVYGNALEAHKFVLMVHGTLQDVAKAKSIRPVPALKWEAAVVINPVPTGWRMW